MKPTCALIALLAITFSGCGDNSPSVGRARLGVNNLNKAVDAYKARHAHWPDSLEVLAESKAEGGEELLPSSALTDPWGHPYHYDPTDRHPETDQPLIWSDGPEPGKAGSKIANWEVKADAVR